MPVEKTEHSRVQPQPEWHSIAGDTGAVRHHACPTKQGERRGVQWEGPRYSPNNFKQTELQSVTAFGPHAQIREYKEASVSSARFCILEVVQGRHHRAGGTSCLAILGTRTE